VIEERVGCNLHFMKVDVLAVAIHANRRGVADEVNVVAALGKLHAEFGGDDARTSVGWIASDANAHLGSFIVSSRNPCAATIHHFATIFGLEAACRPQQRMLESRAHPRWNGGRCVGTPN